MSVSLPTLRTPIILVPGFCGFNRFSVGGLSVARYFPGISEALEAVGNRVAVPWLSATRGVTDRARELRTFINESFPGESVHLIAHSMGGLDSRYMISKLGMDERVVTLTTLGTPHRGTVLMDRGVRYLGRLVKPMLELFDIATKGFYDLTTTGCRAFNAEVANAGKVRYFSVAGDCGQSGVRPEWQLFHSILLEEEGPNDGVVSVRSAVHGELLGTWPCDHLEMVNWNNGIFPAGPLGEKEGHLFAGLMERLAAEE